MANSMEEILHPGGSNHPDPSFPHAPGGWSKDSALDIAKSEQLTLEEDHWAVFRALQEYYYRHQDGTIHARELHDALDEKFHAQGGMKYLYQILPGGPIAQGCRLAGLQAPAGSVDASFGSVQ